MADSETKLGLQDEMAAVEEVATKNTGTHALVIQNDPYDPFSFASMNAPSENLHSQDFDFDPFSPNLALPSQKALSSDSDIAQSNDDLLLDFTTPKPNQNPFGVSQAKQDSLELLANGHGVFPPSQQYEAHGEETSEPQLDFLSNFKTVDTVRINPFVHSGDPLVATQVSEIESLDSSLHRVGPVNTNPFITDPHVQLADSSPTLQQGLNILDEYPTSRSCEPAAKLPCSEPEQPSSCLETLAAIDIGFPANENTLDSSVCIKSAVLSSEEHNLKSTLSELHPSSRPEPFAYSDVVAQSFVHDEPEPPANEMAGQTRAQQESLSSNSIEDESHDLVMTALMRAETAEAKDDKSHQEDIEPPPLEPPIFIEDLELPPESVAQEVPTGDTKMSQFPWIVDESIGGQTEPSVSHVPTIFTENESSKSPERKSDISTDKTLKSKSLKANSKSVSQSQSSKVGVQLKKEAPPRAKTQQSPRTRSAQPSVNIKSTKIVTASSKTTSAKQSSPRKKDVSLDSGVEEEKDLKKKSTPKVSGIRPPGSVASKTPSRVKSASPRIESSVKKTPSPRKAESPVTSPRPATAMSTSVGRSPHIKNVSSKINSFQNVNHTPRGGNVKIESRKLDYTSVQPKLGSKAKVNHVPGGGDKKIETRKLEWKVESKVGSRANVSHVPGGGDVKIESHKLDFKERAQPKCGSKANLHHTPGGGDKVIETRKLDFNEKAQPKCGSKANINHTPGGGNKMIETHKLDFKEKAQAKCGSKANIHHMPGGGNTVIENKKLEWKAEARIGSLQNQSHTPGGGDKKIENRKLEWKAEPRVGSLKNQGHIPGGGDKKIENIKLDWKAESKVGSCDNKNHVPGGGEKKIESRKLSFREEASPRIDQGDRKSRTSSVSSNSVEQ